jgi:NTP pyrophosphatase (non-canonical NTP hydrolase)
VIVPPAREQSLGELREQAGSTQELVRETMLRAGGYWRPLAAVARLLEELGELVELLAQGEPSERELAHELADLWIITTALSDQFLGQVAEPRSDARGKLKRAEAVAEAIVAAGEIARVVNYYDGPKTPREPGELPSLAEAVRHFHDALGAVAGSVGVELAGAVAEKIEVIHGRDMERFEQVDGDPSTAACLSLLRASPALAGNALLDLRLWGAPTWSGSSVREAAAEIEPSLRSFTRAARAEDLEGYVIAGPAIDGVEEPYWLDALLEELAPGAVGAGPDGQRRIELAGIALGVQVLPTQPGEPLRFVLLGRGR